ncbi:MAG: NADH-quinone oxidoreductase subunit NuoE [Phycisphaeraceae bacterium]|nr:NADH-quinone oxidoreductase subunit NuoE [Phycisphaeraceae bacterium]
MAWIVKDSANTKIVKRDEPYLTEAIRAHFEKEILPRYATKQAALLPLMHEIQHTHEWIPHQAMEEAAEFLELSVAEVIDTVTFYEEFRLKPAGQYLIQICRSISCELCGYKDLSARVQKKLGIVPGETTDDGRFTLVELECLGACGGAPAALINEDLHEDVTWEALEKKIDSLAE